ncbi:MAG: hypothetical protein GX139_04920 [Armatimonadetes bacterium]|nr:hypothetical protein [Armatimonadota bacterium]
MAKRVLIALLIIGLLAAGYCAAQRYRVESRNRAVEIVIDWDEVTALAAATGQSPDSVLKHFKNAGATSVAIAEQTFKDAVAGGQITLQPNGEISIDQGCSQRILDYIEGLLPSRSILPRGDSDIPLQYLQQLPIGFPEDALAATRSEGLGVVARLINYPGATPKAIDFMMADAKRRGADVVIFQGDTVLGFKGAVEAAADAMRANELSFGRVEFSKQKGDERLADEVRDRVVIVHSITQAEMPALSETSIIDRFQKSVRERGVRMCYIRMYETAGENLLHDNAAYIAAIAESITKAGYVITTAHSLDEVEIPIWIKTLAALGVAAGVVLTISMVVETPGVMLYVLVFLNCAGLSLAGDTGRKLVALLSALTFPVLAALWSTRGAPEKPTAAPGVLWRAIGRLVGAIAIAACGGLLVVGLLSGRDFMLRIEQFMGVKLAHILPIIVLALLYAGAIAWNSDTWPKVKQRFYSAMKSMGANPVLIWQAAGMLAAVALVGLMVARSGNDSGLGVSGFELRFRSILDKILYVRPRTKEFLVGYPALLVGIAFALRGRREWAAPLVVVGSIGLISALNTFCHIHTPLELSLLRVLNGGIVGLIAGIVVYGLIKNLPGGDK